MLRPENKLGSINPYRMDSLIILLFLIILSPCTAQDKINHFVGTEIQIYPTGFIPGLYYSKSLSNRIDISFRVGANILDHGDQGVQDDEQGHGFGFTPGVKYYIVNEHYKWFTELRCDLWFNKVDWISNEPIPDFAISGSTNITVLQPTMLVGQNFMIKDIWILTPTFSFGFEINTRTKGAEVGDGLIGLVGIRAGRLLR